MSTVEVINAESQISIVPEADDTIVVIASADLTTAIESGEQGPPGLPGPPGAPSYVPGPPGVNGNTILYGLADPTSADGKPGDFYINTTSHFMFGPKASTWPPGTSLIGPQGIPGNTILYGASDPVAGTGVDGNFYINTTTHFLFGPKAGGAWPAGTSMIGPQGAVGPPGPSGGTPSTAPPLMDGTAAPGTGSPYSREDHIHPSDTARVAKAGDTMTGQLVLQYANPAVVLIKTAAAQYANLYGTNGAAPRWSITLGDNNAESGANVGSNFALTAYDDAGNPRNTPIAINRVDGLIYLKGDPTQPLHAATKQYVDANAGAPFAAMAYNGLQLNGGMEVNQFRAAGAGLALANTTAFIVDGWRCASSGVATISAAQNTSAFPGGFQYCLQMIPTVGTSTPGTTDYNIAYQRIEGYAVRNLQWGSASASPVTLSFWIAAGRPGLNSGLITNGITNSRSYAFTYTINVANTWEYKTITIPGDTTGTWVKDNTGGFQVSFCMMGGGTALIAPNVWGSATGVVGAIGQTNNCVTGGDQMLITGVTLFAGSVGPSAQQSVFVARPYHLESARCKRYYQQLGGVLFAGYQGGSGAFYGDFSFLEMRAPPSVVAANMAYSNASTVALNVAYPYHMRLQAVMTATGYGFANGDYSLDATI